MTKKKEKVDQPAEVEQANDIKEETKEHPAEVEKPEEFFNGSIEITKNKMIKMPEQCQDCKYQKRYGRKTCGSCIHYEE